MGFNEFNKLIVINNKDVTEKIVKMYHDKYKSKFTITFEGSRKSYWYNESNIGLYDVSSKIDTNKYLIILDGQSLSGIKYALNFDNRFIKIFFSSGYRKTYNIADLELVENSLADTKSKNSFEYLKEVSKSIGIITDDNKSLLYDQYDKMKFVNPKSVLSKYLNYSGVQKKKLNRNLIFPFGFNLSQKSAVENAFTHNISIIEGPPGTGKTQTILNIISNAVLDNKSIAVVSNNNSATKNVIEKLDKHNVGFVAAFLGKKENKKEFIRLQDESYPNFEGWELTSEEIYELEQKLQNDKNTMDYIHELKNRLAINESEFENIKTQSKYFYDYYDKSNSETIDIKSLFNLNSKRVIKLLMEFDVLNKDEYNIPLSFKLKNFILNGIYDFKFYENNIELIISNLQRLYYDLKIKELEKSLCDLNNKLRNYDSKQFLDDYNENSMKLFKAKLFRKYSKPKRPVFSECDFWKNTDSFVKEYPTILSTTHSLKYCTSPTFLYDYLIIDEASQVDIVAGALALSCAKNVIIVGDDKQLPNVVTNEDKAITDNLFNKYNLIKPYKYSDNSLLSSCLNLFKDAPKTLLKEHYRCNPKIIEFCNKKFYNNELVILTKSNEKNPLVVYETVEGNHARGRHNQRQIDVIVNEMIPQQKLNTKKDSIGIITPYRDQKKKLEENIKGEKVEIDTVHKFQGREKEVIIISPVDNDVKNFSDDPNLLNVAISRAVDKLILVVPKGHHKTKSNIADLINYIKYNNFETIESKVYSVFDLLYKDYSKELLKKYQDPKNISIYKSENLIYSLIEEVISELDLKNIDIVFNQPLKMLIKDTSLLTNDEQKFVNNPSTHTDFLLFNKVSKAPILVVEVDGYQYHENNPIQLKRDTKKDLILKKYGISILRLKTNHSNEKEKLKEVLLSL